MATTLVDVNDLFMVLVNDSRLTALFQSSVTNFNTYLEGWLLFAIDEFDSICTQDLTYSVATQEFTATLTQKNKLVLAQLMTKYWMEKQVQDDLQMRVNVVDRSFKHTSMATNFRERKDFLSQKREEISQLLIEYEYANNSWDDWDNQIYRS